MKLTHGLQLAYCTNIHRGENWAETFDSLNRHTLAVREKVSPNKPYAIGLRLSQRAAQELSDAKTFREFKAWLAQHDCYVFTINGFPYGQFHGTRVKERVYLPDWTSPERLAYTNLLFDLLAELVPEGIEGSVSTLPGSFKEFITQPAQERIIRDNIWRCVEHISKLSERTGRKLHLGLEPEPLGWFETSAETIRFFEKLRDEHPNDPRLNEHLGVNYDTCHLAVEFEEPANVIGALTRHQIKISKLHLSSALKVHPTAEVRRSLAAFADDIYLHQVITREADGARRVFKDLAPALEMPAAFAQPESTEWRIHFHIPLHSPPTAWYGNTSDHVLGVLDLLKQNPALCSHLEMETYTWEVLPPELKNRDVVGQLVAEYDWTLKRLAERGFTV
ncbi:MAG TPA: metabolite traffic protein EboE [Verrucomicrobiae bacterium]|jgi:sugar phosphate isomerase/epimerase|nr:metabolite traffic protein EboE [Verrucomicrobiae bacterium]